MPWCRMSLCVCWGRPGHKTYPGESARSRRQGLDRMERPKISVVCFLRRVWHTGEKFNHHGAGKSHLEMLELFILQWGRGDALARWRQYPISRGKGYGLGRWC